MRLRLSLALMAGVLAAGCTRTPPAAAPVTDARLLTISVVATTDLHGHVEALPWLSAHIETLRAKRRADGCVRKRIQRSKSRWGCWRISGS